MSLLPNLIELVSYLRTFVQQHESTLKDNKYMETDRLSLSDVAKILRWVSFILDKFITKNTTSFDISKVKINSILKDKNNWVSSEKSMNDAVSPIQSKFDDVFRKVTLAETKIKELQGLVGTGDLNSDDAFIKKCLSALRTDYFQNTHIYEQNPAVFDAVVNIFPWASNLTIQMMQTDLVHTIAPTPPPTGNIFDDTVAMVYFNDFFDTNLKDLNNPSVFAGEEISELKQAIAHSDLSRQLSSELLATISKNFNNAYNNNFSGVVAHISSLWNDRSRFPEFVIYYLLSMQKLITWFGVLNGCVERAIARDDLNPRDVKPAKQLQEFIPEWFRLQMKNVRRRIGDGWLYDNDSYDKLFTDTLQRIHWKINEMNKYSWTMESNAQPIVR